MSHIDCHSALHCNVGARVTCQLALEINVKALHLLLMLPSSGRARLSLSDTLKKHSDKLSTMTCFNGDQ